jgi:hypothetical protein
MKRKIKKALEEAAISTFEDICFMYAVPELKDIQNELKLEAAAEVKYQGDYTGKLIIETRGGLFSAIAANILSDDSPTPRQKRDALGEIANIICGNIVTCLGRSRRGYEIEGPRFLNKEKLGKEEQQGKPLSEITLNFNEGRADVKFFVDGTFDAKERKK